MARTPALALGLALLLAAGGAADGARRPAGAGLARRRKPKHPYTSPEGLFIQERASKQLPGPGQHFSFGALKPWEDIQAMLEDEPDRKLLLVVRHGQAISNFLGDTLGPDEWFAVEGTCQYDDKNGTIYNIFDADLTGLGSDQARSLNSILVGGGWLEKMTGGRPLRAVISPLTRCLHTATLALEGVSPNATSVEEYVRETLGEDTCDARRSVSDPNAAPGGNGGGGAGPQSPCSFDKGLASSWPDFDYPVWDPEARADRGFGLLGDADHLWTKDKRERQKHQVRRAKHFLDILFEHAPERVIVVVTHSGFTRSVLLAVRREPYRPQNAELVPVIVDRAPRDNDGGDDDDEAWIDAALAAHPGLDLAGDFAEARAAARAAAAAAGGARARVARAAAALAGWARGFAAAPAPARRPATLPDLTARPSRPRGAMARSRAGKAAAAAAAAPRKQQQQAPAPPPPPPPPPLELECPLCIEVLDDTDRDFFPCSCGYQVCLFCYQRLQSEYNNTCPGCRQQYSDDLDAVRQHMARKQAAAAAEAAAGRGGGGGGAAAAAAAGAHGGHAAAAHAAHAAHSHGGHGHRAGGKGSGAATVRTVPRPGHHHPPHHHHTPEPHGHAAAAAAHHGRGATHDRADVLPATASWVSGAAPPPPPPGHEPPVAAPAPVDDAAWPSLGDAVGGGGAAAHQRSHDHVPVRRQSSSSSLSSTQVAPLAARGRHDPLRSSCDSSVSTLTADAAGGAGDAAGHHQQALGGGGGGSGGFTAVEVTTVVGGARHNVCVPVSGHSSVPPYPEAAALLRMLQTAVHGSTLSSTEAAVQLVQCLRKLEADSQPGQQTTAWLQQALAAGGRAGSGGGGAARPGASGLRPPNGRPPVRAPPPGFGHAPAAKQQQACGDAYAPPVQQQPDAAAARGGYRPLQADAYASQGSGSGMHSVDSNSSLFSQGSSLGAPAAAAVWNDSAALPSVDFSGAGLGGGIPAVPARLQMLWASGGAAGGAAGGGFGAAPSPAPPPGFGVLGGSRLGGYNPLSFADLGAAQQAGGAAVGGAPPGFGFAGGLDGAAGLKQQAAAALYQPWT
ncbi:Cnot4 [Scenedesmus sp. PABB004]|nr:Cnot4 [Scenedesmus sp. PABB004]